VFLDECVCSVGVTNEIAHRSLTKTRSTPVVVAYLGCDVNEEGRSLPVGGSQRTVHISPPKQQRRLRESGVARENEYIYGLQSLDIRGNAAAIWGLFTCQAGILK
jgi:hypothetical protein